MLRELASFIFMWRVGERGEAKMLGYNRYQIMKNAK